MTQKTFLNNMILGGMFMKAEIFYNDKKLGNIEGNTIQELIENNFKVIKSTISDVAGNAAGFTIEEMWIDTACNLHVIAHGSESVINYNPYDDVEKEIIFKITGIPENTIKEKYYIELEEKTFNPFDEKMWENKSIVVGILEGAIDYLAQVSKKREEPSMIVQRVHLNLKENNLSLYISQLMMQFSIANIKKTKANKDIFELIEKTNNVLVELIKNDKTKITTEEIVIYYKTLNYFHKRDKITALKFYRENSGKTQKEIADIVGISLRQYQRYESLNSTLATANITIVEKIANIFSVNITDLINHGTVELKNII